MTEQELVSIIKESATLYYKNGTSPISDSEFDSYVEELKLINPNNPLLSTPGWGYEPEDTEPHLYHKITGISPKYKGFNRTYPWAVISPKFDGGSGIAYYACGKLIKVLTRGNGISGQNITRNLPCVPKSLKAPLTGYVRGEIILSISNFKKHFDSSRSIRNTAVGIATSKYPDPQEIELLEFIPYKIYDADSDRFLSFSEQSEYVDIPFKWKEGSAAHEDLASLVQDYPCDGLVCQTPDGNEFAIKYNEETGITRINSITWNTKGTGIIFPTIHYDTIRLSDADCSNVSGGSYDMILRNGYGIGAEIELVRSGEVIPYILKATKPSTVGIKPRCSYGCSENYVAIKGAHAFCTNPNCPCKNESTYERLINYFAPKNFNYQMRDFIKKEFGSYSGLLAAKRRNLLPDYFNNLSLGCTDHQNEMIVKTLKNIHETSKLSLGWLVFIAEIKGFGDAQANALAEELNGDLSSLNESLDMYKSVQSDAKSSWIERWPVIKEFMKTFKIEQEISKKPSGRLVCISGKLNYGSKSKFNAEIACRGFEQVSSLDSSVEILITNESSTSKCNKAKKLGIAMMSEEDFLKLPTLK